MRHTASGFLLSWAPFAQIEKEDAVLVAAAVRSALAESVPPVFDLRREEFTGITQSRLQAAGVRSESAFMKNARLVHIQTKDDSILVIPHRNCGQTGEKKGFTLIAQKQIALPAGVDDASLGRACIQALALCE